MIEIKLYTKSGGYVETVYIPPFNEMPDVIIWGERFFVLFNTENLEYRECFAATAVVTQFGMDYNRDPNNC